MVLSFLFLFLEVEESLVLGISGNDSTETIWGFLPLLPDDDCGIDDWLSIERDKERRRENPVNECFSRVRCVCR